MVNLKVQPEKTERTMKKILKTACMASFLLSLIAPLKAEVMCTFNGKPNQCEINQGHRTPLTRGSDLDIRWEDGEVTTIKYLNQDKVILNGKTTGRIMFSKKIRMGVFEQGIKSSTGNWFTVKLGD